MLRLHNLDYESLWLDEAFTAELSQKAVDDIIYTTARDVHPPLYYILLHFWVASGTGEWMLRFPSAVFGVLSIFLIYIVARKFYGEMEGLISAFLLTISYIHIFYSKEARMYSMLIFLTLCSVYFFYLALENNKKKWWILFTVATILGVYTHYMMVAVIFAQAIYFLLVEFNWRNQKFSNSNKAKSFALSIIFVLVAYLPMLSMMLSTLTSKAAGGNIFGVQPNIGFFHDVLGWFGADFEFAGSESIFSIIYVVFFAIGIYASKDEYENRGILLISWFIVTIFFGFILASIMHFMPRYVLHALPAYLILISRGIKETAYLVIKSFKIPQPASKAVIPLILVCIVLISYPHLAQLYTKKIKEDWRGCGEYLRANTEAGDTIILEPGYINLPFEYYYNNSTHSTIILDTGTNLTAIQEILGGNKRVWLILTNDIKFSDRDGKVQMYIARNTEFKANYNGVFIFLKEKKMG